MTVRAFEDSFPSGCSAAGCDPGHARVTLSTGATSTFPHSLTVALVATFPECPTTGGFPILRLGDVHRANHTLAIEMIDRQLIVRYGGKGKASAYYVATAGVG